MKLLVYLHVAVKQRAFETLLQTALPEVTPTAVGRIADFDRAFAEGTDAVLTLPIVLSVKGLTPALRGYSKGEADERYALIGSGATLDPAKVSAVGALDVLGREGTTAFVRRLVSPQARVERVTKVEDLLPLLQMQRVDGVIAPSRLFPALQAMSRLPLSPRDLDGKVGLPAMAAVGPGGAAILKLVPKMPMSLSRMLGVDQWR
jgi:hypothetical protein